MCLTVAVCSHLQTQISASSSTFPTQLVAFSSQWHVNKSETHVRQETQMQDAASRCLSCRSDSINGAMGEDDSHRRLMSRRPKGASPPTSLGSTLIWLPSAPTKPCDSWYRAPTNPSDTGDTTRSHVSIQDVGPGCGALRHALGDTAVWRGDGEEVEMSRVWVFLNWWVDLNEDRAKLVFWRLVKPEQIY